MNVPRPSRLRGAMAEEHLQPAGHDESSEYVPGSRRAEAAARRGWRTRAERPARRPWLWPRLAMAAAIALVFVLLGLWPGIQGRLQAAEQITQAEAMLASARAKVSRIDDTVSTQLSAEAEPRVPSIAAEILVARRELNTTVRLIDEASPHLTKQEKSRAEAMRTAATSRLAMIGVAPGILHASVSAVQAKTIGDRAWALTKAAVRREMQSVRMYESRAASRVESAAITMHTAALQLAEARGLYSQAASASPDAGFEQYLVYVDLRRAQAKRLESAAQRWLAGDAVGAAEAYAEYRSAAGKAAAGLAALPVAPGAATGAGFRKVAGAAVDVYSRERRKALEADKRLGST